MTEPWPHTCPGGQQAATEALREFTERQIASGKVGRVDLVNALMETSAWMMALLLKDGAELDAITRATNTFNRRILDHVASDQIKKDRAQLFGDPVGRVH